MFLVVLDDFADDELKEAFGELRIEISVDSELFQPRDLIALAVRIRGGQGVFSFEPTNSLSMFEPFAERIDEDRVEAINALAVLAQDLRGTDDSIVLRCGISQWPILSV